MSARCVCVSSVLLLFMQPFLFSQSTAQNGHLIYNYRQSVRGIVAAIHGETIVLDTDENVNFTIFVGSNTLIRREFGELPRLSLADIHVGEPLVARGIGDDAKLTMDARGIYLDPGFTDAFIRQRQANFGHTWTGGFISAVQGDSVTVRRLDGQSQTFVVDAKTHYRGAYVVSPGRLDLQPSNRISVAFRSERDEPPVADIVDFWVVH